MHLIRTAEDMACALDFPIDPELKTLLRTYAERLEPYGPIENLAHFLITEVGDVLADINVVCGMVLMGGGAAEFAISPELVVRHDGWFEVTFILSDDGFGLILLVPCGKGTDPDLLTACMQALERQGSWADNGL